VAKVIQVRDVPDELHAELRKRAAEAGVSLSDYVLGELARVAQRSGNAEVLLRAATRPGGASRQAILEVIRAGRDER
jgi:plasmid stability protein